MTNTDKLPPLPTRSIGTNLTDHDLDRLDLFRRSQDDLPTRAAVMREAVRFYLDMHDAPLLVMDAIIQGMEAMHGTDETD